MKFFPSSTGHKPLSPFLSAASERTARSPRFFGPTLSTMTPDIPSKAFQARVLVVDDDAGVRDVLERVLTAAGYRVNCAEDGVAGWDALCVGSFDLLIADHEMPRLTGLALLRLVRTVPFSLPVILISGNIPWSEKDLVDLLRPGVAMAKPLSFNELLQNVSDLLVKTTLASPIHERQTWRVVDQQRCTVDERVVSGWQSGVYAVA